MANKGHSVPNFGGGYTHYDDKGHKVGRSERNLFGGFTDYDADGHKVGYSQENLFGGYTHYDSNGHKSGTSYPNMIGGYNHYDDDGNRSGTSSPDLFGGYSNDDEAGCYVATCVYGSYDCPEVWTLRRYRDYKLAESFAGRVFIKCYYAVSPTIVRLVGDTQLFQLVWKSVLDKWVAKLKECGYRDTPYNDRKW